MEEAGLAKRYYTNFILDETKLRRIVAVLAEFGARLSDESFVRFYVEHENDSYWETRSVDDVLAHDNPPGRTIRVLTMTLLLKDGKDHVAKVSFGRESELRAAVTITHTDRDWCFLLGDELDAQIQRTLKGRPLRLLSTRSADLAVVIALLVVTVIWLIIYAWRVPPEFSASEIQRMSMPERTEELLKLAVRRRGADVWYPLMLISVPAMFLVLFEARPISRLVRPLDRPVFYWGDAAAAYTRQQTRLTWLLWSVGVAFVVSVVASLFVAWLEAMRVG